MIERFSATGLNGEVVVVRECLIEGDLSGTTRNAFYHTRANYLAATYREVQKSYFDEVASEFEKLIAAPSPSEFNLWFGYDLFCRANIWFVIFLLNDLATDKQVFVVYPSYLAGSDIWQDFGRATREQLFLCYDNRIPFTNEYLDLASELWRAYKHCDLSTLSRLSKQQSACFPYLEEVCQAHIDRFPDHTGKGRPERVMEELLKISNVDFPSAFSEIFSKKKVFMDLAIYR